ncbi:Villin-like protein, partial [Globisporangium splendens]
MSVDPVFENAGKQIGLVAWRIENMQPVPVPASELGKLHNGDSYIFLKTSQEKSGLSWSIHFWLGKETTADESGVAAYKTVELDESLGGSPVQYRECQGHESELFLSYFKKIGLEYLEGGVASGFNTVNRDEYETRLFQVKGKRTVRVSQVPVKNTSLTVDDVYVLDAGLEVYVYSGKTANRMEKAKGLEFVRKLNNDARGARANITFIEEDPQNAAFWSTLGGYIDVTRVGESDEEHERMAKKSTTVLRISDSGSDLSVENVTPSNGVLTKDILKTEDVFVVDLGDVVYVWVGKGASDAERKNAITIATKYLQKHSRSLHTPITRVIEQGEPPVFQALFKGWTKPAVLDFSRQASVGVASSSQKKLDVNALLSSAATSEDSVGTDPTQAGTHEVTIWRIENMEKVELPKAQYGHFYGGDSYVILHSVTPPSGKPSHVIYFWQGRSSTTDEKASSALWAARLDEEMGGSPVQVRVIQGKEPAHFRALFKGKMIVHAGGKASGFANVNDSDSYDTDGVSLFHVKGTTPENTVASQVDEVAANLNSGDCFILLTPKTIYEWEGAGSSDAERQTTSSISAILKKNREVEIIEEGNESDEFWSFLGGKGPYAKTKAGFEIPHQPRLFHCSNSYGYFNAEEIFDFAQDDLNVDDVFLLDTYTSLYIWIGDGANEQEKREAVELADEYLNLAKSDGREVGTPVITIHCSNEPPMFTSNFLAWDPEFFKQNEFLDPYEARLKKLKEEKEKNQPKDLPGTVSSESFQAPPVAPPAPVKAVATGSGENFTYEQLVAGVDGIDITIKETYLSDAEFLEVMGVSKDEFAKLPKWKQVAKKKEVKLF